MSATTAEQSFAIEDYVAVTEYEDGSKKVVIGDMYEVHPDASEFEPMPYNELLDLAKSIETSGLRQPILTDHEGRIVDGQNRLIACLVLGLDPEFDAVSGSVRDAIIDLNIRRRHMTPSQRAILLSKFGAHMTQAKRAEVAQVGVRTQAQADKVVESGVPELQEAVQDGVVPLHNAVQVASLPSEKQAEIMQEFGKNDRVIREPKKKAPKAESAESVPNAVEVESEVSEPQRDPLRAAAEQMRGSKATYLDKVKWHTKAENVIGGLLGKIEPDLKEWAKKDIAGIVNATVRLQIENEQKAQAFEDSVLDAAGVVDKVGKIVKSLPKSERAEAEKAIGDKYAPKPEPIRKHEQVLSIIEGLSQAEKKKLLKALSADMPATEAPQAAAPVAELPEDPKKVPDAFRRRVVEIAKAVAKVKLADDEQKKAMIAAVEKIGVACAEVLTKTGAFPDAATVEFPQHLAGDEFRELWSEWIALRRKTKGHTSNKTQNRQLSTLANFDLRQATEIVSKAIDNEWQGIPAFSQLRESKWDGRQPAGPSAASQPKAKPAPGSDEARAAHGSFDDTSENFDDDLSYDEMIERAKRS